jgi:hypothetical protein
MTSANPRTELDKRFSSPGASAAPWADATAALENAEIFWITTVRPDGRPHVTPLLAIWLDDVFDGPREDAGGLARTTAFAGFDNVPDQA